MGNKGTEGSYTLAKLKGTENYKEWAREMGFALQDAGLESYADGTSIEPKLYTESEKNPAAPAKPLSEEKIEKRQAEVEKWVLNNSRTCGKIGKMCSRSVQQQLKKTWTAKEMWDNLQSQYTAAGWYSKWQILNRLEEASYVSSKNMVDFGLTMKTILEELQDAAITIEDHVTVKVINSLGPRFETYVTALNEKARNEKSLPNLDSLLKSLEEEEIRMTGKTSLNNVQASSSSGSSRGGSGGRGRGGRGDCGGQGGRGGRGGSKGGSSNTTDYTDTTCHRCQKKGHIANRCTEPAPVPKDDAKSGKALGAIQLGAITLSQVGDLKNLDLLDSGATDHAHNSRDAFINFRPIKEEACTATEERIISYGRGDVVKKFTHADVMFTNVLYIPTLVNNLYSISRLCHRGWDINMKHSGETTFSVNNKVIGYADEFQGEYIMRFVDPVPKLHALAKPTKDLTTRHARVAHLGYKNLQYVMGMDEVSGPASNELCGWCMMGRQQQEISRTPTTRSTVFLDLLHFDLEGPLPRTFRGFRYILLVKDDATALIFFFF